MKKMMKKVMMLAGLFVSSSLFAGSDDFKVKGVGISTSSGTIFLDVTKYHSQSSCSDKNSFRFKTNHPLYQDIYATLLTAKATDSTVTIAFTDDASLCVYNSPQILSVYLK
ncbi:hypothetical protein [Pseudoalteromonas sp. PPB1]|uniref:hypothetical protein n=1 Tax=Pseudoalteromonas sp. PPB1 TaxID=2756136 RepID=UPI001890B7C9|nr:hypothetical protein [Pseudoalteromonas sp. PPB1]